MMKKVVLLLITLILFVLDVSVLPFLTIGGYYPSLLSLFFFIYVLNNDKVGIFYFSIVVGFFQDVFFYNGFGINTLLNLLLGILVYYLLKRYSTNKHIISIFFVVCAYMLKSFFIFIYLFLMYGLKVKFIQVLYEVIYVFIVLLIIYPLLNCLFKSRLFKKALEF